MGQIIAGKNDGASAEPAQSGQNYFATPLNTNPSFAKQVEVETGADGYYRQTDDEEALLE